MRKCYAVRSFKSEVPKLGSVALSRSVNQSTFVLVSKKSRKIILTMLTSDTIAAATQVLTFFFLKTPPIFFVFLFHLLVMEVMSHMIGVRKQADPQSNRFAKKGSVKQKVWKPLL